MIFKNENNCAVATTDTGLKVIAHACGLNIGIATTTPLSKEDAVVKIYTSLEQFNVQGESMEVYVIDDSLTINCVASDLPNNDISSDEFRDFYIDRLIEMTTPVGEVE